MSEKREMLLHHHGIANLNCFLMGEKYPPFVDLSLVHWPQKEFLVANPLVFVYLVPL